MKTLILDLSDLKTMKWCRPLTCLLIIKSTRLFHEEVNTEVSLPTVSSQPKEQRVILKLKSDDVIPLRSALLPADDLSEKLCPHNQRQTERGKVQSQLITKETWEAATIIQTFQTSNWRPREQWPGMGYEVHVANNSKD